MLSYVMMSESCGEAYHQFQYEDPTIPFFEPTRGIYPKEYVEKRVFLVNMRGQLQDEVEI
jgi:hypothetical protein